MYAGRLCGADAVAKHRFAKSYRVEVLDKRLREGHMGAEARGLAKARLAGVHVPRVLMVDKVQCIIYVERVPGCSLKAFLLATEGDTPPPIARLTDALLAAVGTAIAALHNADIIHGDLTTSNFMLRLAARADADADPDALTAPVLDPAVLATLAPADVDVVAIDFGLSAMARRDGAEDKAVDLYVLERAFVSTHPSVAAFSAVLEAYAAACNATDAVFARLESVRARGRKRECFG